MQKTTGSILLSCLLSVSALGQSVDSVKTRDAERAMAVLTAVKNHLYDPAAGLYLESDKEKNEHPHSYLWGVCAMIQAANELEVLHPKEVFMQPVINTINQYYDTKAPAPGYDSYVVKEGGGDRFYDDNQWIAIAYLDAYARTKRKFFLDKGAEIYRFMMTGYDTARGGGLYWKEGDLKEKNTCSNGPAALVALQMYEATKKKVYLDTALQIYHWVNKRLQAPEGYYWDGLRMEKNTINTNTYTYNSGTMLEANVKLYHITKDKKYLLEAQRIAEASYNHFFHNGRFPHATYWFNAVLLRGYIALYKVDKNRKYIDAMQQEADAVWNNERDANNLLGPHKDKDVLGQGGMIEIYARLAAVK
jgi:hypothetical protein